jgi:hypothetical protein
MFSDDVVWLALCLRRWYVACDRRRRHPRRRRCAFIDGPALGEGADDAFFTRRRLSAQDGVAVRALRAGAST